MFKHLFLATAVVLAFTGSVLLSPGCSKSDSGTDAAPSVITVSGKVVGTSGQPVVGIPVFIGTLPASVTDGSGKFTIPNVTTPYTITAVDGVPKIGAVYIGLTRSDPVLTFFLTPSGTSLSATVSGTISGGAGFPEPASHKTLVAFVSPEVASSTTAATATGAYSRTPTWFGPATTTGILHALQWQFDGGNLPVTFKGYGTKAAVALSNGGTFAGQNVAMSPIAQTNVSGSVVPPAGYAISSKTVTVLFGSTGGIQIVSDGTTTASFTYNTPNIAGATLRLQGVATKVPSYQSAAFKVGVPPNGTNQTITIPAAPEYTFPVAGATLVNTTTDFSWTAFPNGVHMVLFSGGAGQPSYQVITAGTTAKIPNLTSVGLPLPAAATYSWVLIGVAPFTSIDQAAGAGLFAGITTGATADGSFGFAGLGGGARTFTTAP